MMTNESHGDRLNAWLKTLERLTENTWRKSWDFNDALDGK